jgi:hypothetical protein
MQTRACIPFFVSLLALIVSLVLPTKVAFAAATITIVNMDGPDEGFNDPTPATPVGENPGTTLGQQRLNAFRFAANIWGASLDSNVEIFVEASFDTLGCTATSATLGSAGAIVIVANFSGSDLDNTWYPIALANRLAGTDLDPLRNDIRVRFNSNLGQPGCLTGVFFYLGLDNNHGNDIDLVTVLLHEFAHGLGFANFVNESTGARMSDLGDIYSEFTRDLTTGKKWNDMTSTEIVASAMNTRKVIWDGLSVTEAVPSILTPGTPLLRVHAPAGIAGDYQVGPAVFGPPLSAPGVTGNVVAALDPADAAGPSTFDACSPLTNGEAMSGNIALVDRGTCAFVTQVKHCQDAGAIAVLVADNVAGSPPAGLGGTDPTITIPSVRLEFLPQFALQVMLSL